MLTAKKPKMDSPSANSAIGYERYEQHGEEVLTRTQTRKAKAIAKAKAKATAKATAKAGIDLLASDVFSFFGALDSGLLITHAGRYGKGLCIHRLGW